jgi:hypothetical protein
MILVHVADRRLGNWGDGVSAGCVHDHLPFHLAITLKIIRNDSGRETTTNWERNECVERKRYATLGVIQARKLQRIGEGNECVEQKRYAILGVIR